MNKVELMGRLVSNAELKKGKTGTDYANFTLAVPRKGKEAPTDFINCIAFGKTAEAIVNYTEKGNRLIVEGSLQIESYEAKDGTKKSTFNIMVNDFYFVDFKAKNSQEK